MHAVDMHHVKIVGPYRCCIRAMLSCILVIMVSRVTCIVCCCLLRLSSCDVHIVTWCKLCCSASRMHCCMLPLCFVDFVAASSCSFSIPLGPINGAACMSISESADPINAGWLSELWLQDWLMLVTGNIGAESELSSLRVQGFASAAGSSSCTGNAMSLMRAFHTV